MTSRDPKRSRSDIFETQYLDNCARYMVSSYGLPIGNHTLGIQWSHDQWRHVTPKGQGRDQISLKLNISRTVRDTWSVHIDYQQESTHWGSSDHMTDDVTWPERSKSWPLYLWSLISSKPDCNKTANINVQNCSLCMR